MAPANQRHSTRDFRWNAAALARRQAIKRRADRPSVLGKTTGGTVAHFPPRPLHTTILIGCRPRALVRAALIGSVRERTLDVAPGVPGAGSPWR